MAEPWPRFWARILDIWIEVALIGFAIGFLWPEIFTLPIFSGQLGNFVFGLLTLPLAFILDAVVHGLFGTTPGKALAGLRVETLHLERVRTTLALRRNLQVYLHGFWLGIPLLSLIAFSRARDRLQTEDATQWDEALQTSVFDRGNSMARTVVTAVLALTINFGANIYDRYAAAKQPEWDAQKIVAALPELNRGLPLFLDEVTRFDRVSYQPDENVLNHEFTFIHRDASPVGPKELAGPAGTRPRLLADYCGPHRSFFRDRNIPARYRFRRGDGEVAFEQVVYPADCPKG